MYFALDEEGNVVEVNHYGADQLGYTVEELVGQSVLGVFHKEDHDGVRLQLERLLRDTHRVLRWRFRKIRKDGSELWVEEYGRTVIQDDGSKRVLVVCHDITDRVQTERALADSEERFRAVVEQSADCIFLIDLDSRAIVEANPALSILLGYTREELLGMTLYDFVDHDREDVDERIREIIAANGAFLGERTYRRKDDERVTMQVSVNMIHYGGREVMAVVSRDVTEVVRAREERRHMDEQIQSTQKLESLAVLAGGVAHDFSNLLTGILGHSELALMDLGRSMPSRGAIEHIQRGARRAAELCDQLRAYSGRGQFLVEPVCVSSLVREMSPLVEAAVQRKTVLEYELSDDAPLVDADASQIRQVVMNLVTNASEAMEGRAGVITISTGAIACPREYLNGCYMGEQLPEGDYVFLEVQDTGFGIDPETIEHVFEPFFSTKFTGRGLGLAAVSGIVRGHGGTLHVKSEPSAGSAFRVLLPRSELQRSEYEGRPAAPLYQGQGRVLLVDDEELVRTVGTTILERFGFEVLCAAGGHEAIEVFGEHRGELRFVILDTNMPDLSGRETYDALRKIDASVPLMLCSGYSEMQTMRAFGGAGSHVFLRKPYDVEVVSRRVRELLEPGE